MADTAEPQRSEATPHHTPGPWHRCEAQPDAIVGPRCKRGACSWCDGITYSFGDETAIPMTYGQHFGGHFVCESVSSENFDLIRSAPDLLAACEAAARYLATEKPAGSAPIVADLVWAITDAKGQLDRILAESRAEAGRTRLESEGREP